MNTMDMNKTSKVDGVKKNLVKQARKAAAKKYFAQFKSPFVILMFIWLAVICFTYLYGIYWGLITSLKDILNFNDDIFGWPRKLMFSNYTTAFKHLYVTIEAGAGTRRVMFPELLFNSITYAVVMPCVTVFSQMLVAYAASKYHFRFNKVLHFCVVLSIVVPPIGSLGMSLQIARTLGIYDNFLMYAITSIGFANSGFLIWYGVFNGISSEYMDAAKIDGAGHFRILITIMLPLARVPIMILWVLAFIGSWNTYSVQYTMLPSMPNLSLALWYFQFDLGNEISWPPMQIAASMITALPCLVLYFTFQKWFVGNLTSGGLKG